MKINKEEAGIGPFFFKKVDDLLSCVSFKVNLFLKIYFVSKLSIEKHLPF